MLVISCHGRCYFQECVYVSGLGCGDIPRAARSRCPALGTTNSILEVGFPALFVSCLPPVAHHVHVVVGSVVGPNIWPWLRPRAANRQSELIRIGFQPCHYQTRGRI